jgi:hypothetical protein
MKHFILSLFAIVLLFGACKKNDQPNKNASRTLKFEVNGSFSGSLVVSYTSASGNTVNDTRATLPWSKEITYESNVSAAIIAISGNGGTVGQQVTVVVKRGSAQASSTTATADNSGSFSRSAPVVIL